jgi:hypothetical protein
MHQPYRDNSGIIEAGSVDVSVYELEKYLGDCQLEDVSPMVDGQFVYHHRLVKIGATDGSWSMFGIYDNEWLTVARGDYAAVAGFLGKDPVPPAVLPLDW